MHGTASFRALAALPVAEYRLVSGRREAAREGMGVSSRRGGDDRHTSGPAPGLRSMCVHRGCCAQGPLPGCPLHGGEMTEAGIVPESFVSKLSQSPKSVSCPQLGSPNHSCLLELFMSPCGKESSTTETLKLSTNSRCQCYQ